ncbi:MAG: hypothetical protein IPJ65_26130 [Archangiaceae bacterium]|nr:hypothetical protein [Archangiaceae bacterium]
MRVPLLIATAVLAVMAGAAYWASRRLVEAQRPAAPRPAFRVSVPARGRVSQNEQNVEQPLEEKLSAVPGITRLRGRTTERQVEVEVWAPPGTRLDVPGVTVTPLDLPAERYFLVTGQKRPQVLGEVCGREEPSPLVVLDPLRLQAMNLDAVAVDRALKATGDLETLSRTPLGPGLRLSDVATVRLEPPLPACAVRVPEGAWLVTARQQELEGATRLEAPTRVELDGPVPKLVSVQPRAVTVRLPNHVTLYFSPALSPAQRALVLGELRQQPGTQVRHVDGVKRVRIVLTGTADREVLGRFALDLVPLLQKRPGAELVVGPAQGQPGLYARVDAERAAALGLAVADLEALVSLAREGSAHDGLRVTLPLAQPDHLGALMIRDRRLAELVTLSTGVDPPELLRVDRQRAVEVVAYGLDHQTVGPVRGLPYGAKVEFRDE